MFLISHQLDGTSMWLGYISVFSTSCFGWIMSPEYEPCPWKPCLFLFQNYCTSMIICIFVWPALAYLALCLLWLILLVLAHVFVILVTVRGGDFPSQFFWLVIIPHYHPWRPQKKRSQRRRWGSGRRGWMWIWLLGLRTQRGKEIRR